MTTQQRDALAKANLHRRVQKDLKRRLREQDMGAGKLVVRAIIGDPTPEIRAMQVDALLRAIHAVGKHKATGLLRSAHVSPTRRLGDLTDRERRALDRALA